MSESTAHQGKTDAHDWFIEQLAEYSAGLASSPDDPELLKLADRLRSGRASLEEQQACKGATLAYIRTCLAEAPASIQSAFLKFLLLSDLASEATEVRIALDAQAKPDAQGRLSDLTLNIVGLLLRASRPPSDNTAVRIFPPLRKRYTSAPNWRDVAILAGMVGRPTIPQYSEDDLICDLALLSRTPEFEQELAIRDAIWRKVRPTLDAIDIAARIRRRRGQFVVPFDYEKIMKRTEEAIVEQRQVA